MSQAPAVRRRRGRGGPVLLLGLTLAAMQAPAAPAAPRWQSTAGPYGGTVQSLQRLDDGTLVAATLNAGVFRRANADSAWQRARWPLAAADVRALTRDGDRLYAASYGGGVLRSDDGGASWLPLGAGTLDTEFFSVAARGDLLLAGTRRGRVLRSEDAGGSWTPLRLPGVRATVTAMLFADGRLWVASNGDGVLVSADDGLSYEAVVAGLGNRAVLSLAQFDGAVVAATRGGVYRFAGDAWRALGHFPVADVVVSLYAEDDALYAGTVGAGVLRFTPDTAAGDTGSEAAGSWTRLGGAGRPVVSIARQQQRLLAATFGTGVLAFDGSGWRADNRGLTGSDVRAVAVDAATLFAATDAGLFISPDNGVTWISRNTGLADTDLVAVAVADLDAYVASSGGNLFASVDRGERWSALPALPDQATVRSLAVTGQRLFAATDRGIYRSGDGGRRWEPLSGAPPGVRRLAAGGELLFGTDADEALMLSTDGGANWRRLAGPAGLAPRAFAGDSHGVYVATAAGLMRRRAQDVSSWRTLLGAPADNEIRALAYSYPYLIAGTRGGGVLTLEDGSLSWTRASLPLGIDEILIAGDARYAAAADGVYRSLDEGASWSQVSPRPATRLARAGERVFAATDEGLFMSRDRGEQWEVVPLAGHGAVRSLLLLDGDLMYAGAGTGATRSGAAPGEWVAAAGLEHEHVLVLAAGAPLLAGTPRGLFRSDDGGHSWQHVADPLLHGAVHAIARGSDATFVLREGHLLAGDAALAQWRTLAPDTDPGFLHDVRARGRQLFVAGDDGVWQSPDQGRTWIALQPPASITRLAFADREILAAGAEGVWAATLRYAGDSASAAAGAWVVLCLSLCLAARRRGAGAG